MKEKNLFWIISRIKYEVLKPLKADTEYVIKTWPLKPTKLNFQREYLILDKDGSEVVKGSANWLTMDRATRRLVIGAAVFPDMEFCDAENFSSKVMRLRDFDNGEFKKEITLTKEHIDSNGHVNNKHYTTLVEEALNGFSSTLKSFQIDYVAEIMENDKVSVYTLNENEAIFVKGETDKINFIAKIETEL